MRLNKIQKPEYALELTEDELVALGLLSYRHEWITGSATSFYGILPESVRQLISRKAPADQEKTTKLNVDWRTG